MRKTREVLRLKWALGLAARQVAGSAGLARLTVGEYLRRAEAAGLTWQKVTALTVTPQTSASRAPPRLSPRTSSWPIVPPPSYTSNEGTLSNKSATSGVGNSLTPLLGDYSVADRDTNY